ncbi:hypothetical protein CBS14141_000729 [Malassezia furfur]|nr:hypothetical protein CBS14141_000729 [Malassezia furfur]
MDHDAAHAVPALALPAPLAAGDALLSPAAQRTFDVDAFLCSRAYGQDVHTILHELRAYSHALHERLLEVIHAKYRDFVALASRLRADAAHIQALAEHADVARAHDALARVRATLADVVEQLGAEQRASADARRRKVHTLLASALARADDAALRLALRAFRALRTYDRAALAHIDRACVAPTLAACVARGAERTPLDPHARADDDAALAALTGLERAPPPSDSACPLACVLNGMLDAAAQLARMCAAAESVGGASLDVFNDVLWRRAATQLLDEHGETLFFVGRPDAFHRNYTLYQQFAAQLVAHAPSARARAAWARTTRRARSRSGGSSAPSSTCVRARR